MHVQALQFQYCSAFKFSKQCAEFLKLCITFLLHCFGFLHENVENLKINKGFAKCLYAIYVCRVQCILCDLI